MAKTGVKKVLTEEEKRNAVLYVKRSGFYITRLADYMGLAYKTMRRILKEDKDFSKRVKKAESDFVGKLVKDARPDFVLKTKYRKEFPQKVHLEHKINPEEEMKKIDDKLKQKWPTQEDSTNN